jgi:excisionase family DNA binding protein
MSDATARPRGRTVGETATELSLSVPTIYRLLGQQRLAAVKVGSRTLITSESIDAYWRSLPAAEFRTPKQKVAA